jgi:hypothetical protein
VRENDLGVGLQPDFRVEQGMNDLYGAGKFAPVVGILAPLQFLGGG